MKRVLVVDDSPTMRQMIAMALRRMPDLSIEEAGDGMEALRRVRQQTYDLIITDINMPMMDGLKLVSLIRQDPQYLTTPIMIVTTEAGEADRDRAFALGANAYITKPIQAPAVSKKVRELIG